MPTPADDLRTILYQKTLGTPDDPSGGYHEDSSRMDMLMDVARGLEVGDYTYAEAKVIFDANAPQDFDFAAWYAEQVEAGDYNEPT